MLHIEGSCTLLFDNEHFVVTCDEVPGHTYPPRQVFTIVDKFTNRFACLSGPTARVFTERIRAWQCDVPDEDEVCDYLAGCVVGGQNLVTH